MALEERLSILIVDDSAFFLTLIADKLESNYDMRTTTASNAAEAMSKLGQETVDCIVSDYEMPETTGLELYEMVDERYDIPFILLTGQGDEKVASEAIRTGVDEYLLKQSVKEEEPLELLVNRIQNVVEQWRTQRNYELLVDNSPDEITQINADGKILAANESVATSFGVAQEELLGQHLSAFLPEDVATRRLEEGQRAMTVGSAVTFQDSIGVRHFHNIAVPLSTAGDGDSFQLVTRDITLQKQHERDLQRKSQKLTLINRIVRHDINNDLQLQMAWADHLEDHVDDEGLEYVERINETSDHIAELTSIARDFVESLEDDTEISLKPTDVSRVLESEIEKKRATFDDAEIVAGELPRVKVRANELLSSVFGNLLNNAVRHNDSNEPEVHVTVEATDTDVVVRVADNGPGVPDDRKEEIFGKGSMGPESPGTGVGLYLVYTLVDQYGGRIWVEDRAAQSTAGDPVGSDDEATGAVFVVELPKYPDGASGFQ